MKRTSYIRLGLITLIAMAVAAGPIAWGSQRGVATMFNAPLRWIPRKSPARELFNQFLEEFDHHEMLMISWPGCTVDDHRLEHVEEALVQVREERLASGEPDLYNQVLTGYSLLRELTSEPIELSRDVALRRLQGTVIGPDRETSCVAVALTDQGALDRVTALALILDHVQRVTGCPRDELRLSGPPVDGIAIDEESIRSIYRYSVPSAVISLVLCCICLRSIWLTLPIMATGVLGQGLMLASVYYLGTTMNAILIVLPPLVFVLTVSAGVHLVNYFMDELQSGDADRATDRALARGRGPCTLAAVTTAIGLASLMVSEVRPVRQFGGLAAPGVLMCVLLLFLLIPAAMEVRIWWFSSRKQRQPHRAASASWGAPVGQTMAALISRYANGISVMAFALILLCGIGLFRLQASLDVVTLLTPKNRAVQDYSWFQQHIGPLVPVEVLIHFDDAAAADKLQQMELVRDAQREMSKIEVLDGAMSAASFFPQIPYAGGLRQITRRSVLRRLIESRQEELVSSGFLAVKDNQESWRISARVMGQKDVDYGQFLERLRERVSPVVAKYEQSGQGAIRATYTGVTSVVFDVQRAMLSDLFYSFLTAVLCVTVVMICALQSVRAGLIAMVPNLFPTLILFGAMSWLGRRVDIGTIMTASVALGIAVDGTFHFLKWFRHESERGKSRREAVGYAYRHCGRALAQTTVICALGLLVYGLSGFLPARHFAWVLMLLLILALIGDLVVLPALLVSPLGRFFVRHRGPALPAAAASVEARR